MPFLTKKLQMSLLSRCNNTYNPKGVKHQECEPVHRLRATVEWNTSIRFYVVIQVYEPNQCSAVHGGQIYMLAPGRVQRWKKIIIGACAAERNQSKIGQGAGAAPVRHSVLSRAHLLPIRLPPAIKEEPPYLAGVDRSQPSETTSPGNYLSELGAQHLRTQGFPWDKR